MKIVDTLQGWDESLGKLGIHKLLRVQFPCSGIFNFFYFRFHSKVYNLSMIDDDLKRILLRKDQCVQLFSQTSIFASKFCQVVSKDSKADTRKLLQVW